MSDVVEKGCHGEMCRWDETGWEIFCVGCGGGGGGWRWCSEARKQVCVANRTGEEHRRREGDMARYLSCSDTVWWQGGHGHGANGILARASEEYRRGNKQEKNGDEMQWEADDVVKVRRRGELNRIGLDWTWSCTVGRVKQRAACGRRRRRDVRMGVVLQSCGGRGFSGRGFATVGVAACS